jgi:hypothetical protein
MSGNNPPDDSVKPLVVRPRVARRMYGDCSLDDLYEKIRSGEVESYLDGRRRLITVASIEADIARNIAAAKAGFQRGRHPLRAQSQRREAEPRPNLTPQPKRMTPPS